MATLTKCKLTVATGLAAGGLFSYLLIGRPIARPLFLFAALAASTGIVADLLSHGPRRYIFPATLLGVFNGFGLRLTAYLHTPSVGLDYGAWLARIATLRELGHVTGGDMYAASPLYFIEMSTLQSILSLSGADVRYATILSASILPVLIGSAAYYLTGRARVGGMAALFSAFFPLFLRVSPLLESEYLAVPWFVTVLLLFMHAYRASDRRIRLLLIGMVSTSVMLHFFYSVMMWGTVTAGFALALILTGKRRIGFSPPHAPQVLFGACLISALVIPSWQLWSVYGHTSVITALSAVSVDLSSVLTPSGESALSESTRGGVTLLTKVGKYLGIAIPLGLGGIGGLLSLWDTRRRDSPGIVLALAVGIGTVGLLVAGLDYNLGFRMFYAVGVAAAIFAAIGTVRLRTIPQLPTTPTKIALTGLIIIAAFTAPLSGLGNNTDPRFGGTSWAVSQSESDQLTAIESTLAGGHKPTSALPQVHPYFLPETPQRKKIVASSCGDNATVLTTGKYHICSI